MRSEWAELDRRIGAFDDEFAARAKADDAARRLATIPGIGPLNATALAAAVGDGAAFARGRDLAAWLGLVPRQATTGGKPKLLRACTLPLTGQGVVDMVVTELGVFDVTSSGLVLVDVAPGVTLEEIRSKTEASFEVHQDLKAA